MDKSILQTMLGALPDDKLMAALQFVMGQQGSSMDDNTGSVLGGMSVDNHIQPWSQVKITFGGEDKNRPSLVDKQWIAPKAATMAKAPMGVQMMTPNDGAGETNPFLQTGGGV